MKSLLACSLASILAVGTVTAQNADVTVIHGIPGLPKAVEVFANNAKLFAFDYAQSKGPLSLKPGTYKIEVKLDGKTVLSASPTLEAGKNYTAIAHLKEKSGIQLSFYVNDASTLARGKSRLEVRHTAKAPTVDVWARRAWWFSRSVRLVNDLSNPNSAKAEVSSSTYYVWLTPGNSTRRAFGPVRLRLASQTWYGVYAIGELGKSSFRLFLQTIDLSGGSKLVGLVRGKPCGGKIGISTKSPAFDKAFDVTLSGGTKSGVGLFHIGNSDSRLGLLRLPLSLNFLGLTGCTLYQNTPIIRAVRIDAMGNAKSEIKLPSSVASSFREIHFQYSFIAPRSNRLGILLTDYASVERN